MKNEIVIGSRESRLAVVQTQIVLDYIKEACPGTEARMLTMKTTGDVILDKTLDKVGGKGLFVKELDRALLEKRTDLSVHSLKDMPMEIPEELPIVAFSGREDPRDVLVLPEGKTEIDFSKPIGCSSLRRILQLQRLYPQATFQMIRGNVQTRLKKLDSGEYGATILAAAGLKRLGLEGRISRYFSVDEMIPAAGQGILAVQGRKGEDYGFLEGFDEKNARAAALAERAFVRRLNGGCSFPAAAHGTVSDGELLLRGLYYSEEDQAYLTGTVRGAAGEAESLGIFLADALAKAYREKRTGKPGFAGNEDFEDGGWKDLGEKKNTADGAEEAPAGKVWLVGAGPGDPGLFTVKGQQVLAKAQVVVYDALVGQSILNQIPESAKRINVGKRSSHHLKHQYEINQVLVDEALKGYRVVRLKGGDPFVFGRGGEEAEALRERGIPYEVVPGVTSAVAVPAYNGIPVTHRDFCSSLHIITGHKKQGDTYDIDFEALVRTKGTLIFLMGVTALPDICRELVAHGMEPDMPAAILQKGTTAGQKRIVATVSTLPEEVRRQGIETPAVIVVGKVCALADRFAWYEELPLAGRRIVVTRPKELISRMASMLREKGAEVLELPAIRTVAQEPGGALDAALDELRQYQWLVFTSPMGVRIFFRAMERLKMDLRALGGAKIAAIGTGTEKELNARGLYADLIPETFDGEALGHALAARLKEGDRVLIPRAAAGNQELTRILAEAPGVRIDDVASYHTEYESQGIIDEKAEFEAGNIDYAVFTSASTVRGFARAVEGLDFSRVKAVCIGKQTKAAADALGMETYMADKATMESVVDCVERLCARAS